MEKRIKIAGLLMFFALAVAAQAGDFTYTTNSDNTITITGYTGSGSAVTIPAAIDGLPVGGIGRRAFYFQEGLTSVTIPNKVTSIGEEAFAWCTSLTNVMIGNGVTSIGNSAFQGCYSLTKVTIGNGVTSIGKWAFFGCVLTSVTIPNSVVCISDYAFYRSGLTSITIPVNVTSIGRAAFAMLSVITLDSGNSFFSSTNGVLFNRNQTTLIQYPLGGRNYIIPSSVTCIGDFAFYSCTNLTSVAIPNSVTSIGAEAFRHCTSLTNVIIPNSVTNIGGAAFVGTSLTSITIPDSVTSIGDGAFQFCPNLTKVYFVGNAPKANEYVFSGADKATVYRLSSVTGWPTVPDVWAGRPTALWYPHEPTLKITSPTAKLKVLATNGLFAVRGTASGDRIVTNVLLQLNGGSWTSASTTNGWMNWSLPVTLIPGRNTICAYSVDSAGNHSSTSVAACTYLATGTLTIETNGVGTVTRAPAGAPEIGKRYTLTAAPGAGSVFANWTGDVESSNKSINFVMTSDLTVAANFTDIVKPTVAITRPTIGLWVSNEFYKVRGTATDNKILDNVLVQLNDGTWTNAVTINNWKNWSATVQLVPGVNIIRACSRDVAQNNSLSSITVCYYVAHGTLTIQTNGPGTVTRAPAGVPVVGKTYTLTATPKPGFGFRGWTNGEGRFVSTDKVLTFTMPQDKMLTANFTDIQKPVVKIVYPTASLRVMTNGTVVLRGTAADNGRLNRVVCQLRDGVWTNAVTTNLWKNWAAEFYPVSGLNTVRVYSVDMQGNVSAPSKVVFTYVPGAVMQVQASGEGSITPVYNGKVLEIGKSYTMTATAKAGISAFTNWTFSLGGALATNKPAVTFVMQSNLVLTANFRSLLQGAQLEKMAGVPAEISVDGKIDDWAGVPCSPFSYTSTGNQTVTQKAAVALSGNTIALLLTGCPFGTSDTVLVYFKLSLNYGDARGIHTVDVWTSGSVLYGMVDGQVFAGLEAVLSNGVLEVEIPVEQAPSQVILEEVGCGLDCGDGTMKELFRIVSP